MKKITTILTILFFTIFAGNAQNLVLNGGFDNSSCGGPPAFVNGCVPDWTHSHGRPYLQYTTVNGDESAFMSSGDDGNGNMIGSGILTDVEFNAGCTYAVSFKTVTGTNSIGNLNISDSDGTIFLKATNGVVPQNNYSIPSTTNEFTIFEGNMAPYFGGWTTVTTQFTAAEDFSQLMVYPSYLGVDSIMYDGATMLIDDIVVELIKCCNDSIYIEPYWEFCESKDVCDLDFWPIRILDQDGNPITTANSDLIIWTNTETGETITNEEWIYTETYEEWCISVVIDEDCRYNACYQENCCRDSIHIEALICPDASERNLVKSVNWDIHKDLDINTNDLNNLSNLACDPCDIGFVLVQLQDVNGDPIGGNGCTILWNDGSTSVNRILPTETLFTVTVTKLVNEGMDSCVYVDSFYYECCSPINSVRFDCRDAIIRWDEIQNVSSYTVELHYDDPSCCKLHSNLPKMNRWEVDGTSFQLPYINISGCFSYRIGYECDGEMIWSDAVCVNCRNKKEDEPIHVYELKASPNPTNGRVSIHVQSEINMNGFLNVYSKEGELLERFSMSTNEDITINIARYPSNIIFYQFEYDGNTSKMEKIILLR